MTAKHKLRLSVSKEKEELIHSTIFKSIRNKVLQKLVLIWLNAFFGGFQLAKDIEKRLKENNLIYTRENVAYTVTDKDIMEIIGCSERTAREYRDALRILFL